VQVDETCAYWIAEGLLSELGPDFQPHQLHTYQPKLRLRVNGPHRDKEYVPVLLSALPCAVDPQNPWTADVWKELVRKFEDNVQIPDYLFSILKRVESAMEHFFLSVSTLSPTSAEKPGAKGDRVPAALEGILGSTSMRWLGKKMPEELLLHILRQLKDEYDIPLTELAQRESLAQIVVNVCQEGAPPVAAVTQSLTFLYLKPLGTREGTIVPQHGAWVSLDASSESLAVHSGSAVSKAAVVADISDLITHLKILLDSYLVAYQVRWMLYPDEERFFKGLWLDSRRIQNFTRSSWHAPTHWRRCAPRGVSFDSSAGIGPYQQRG
jgi:hypothetical protein